MGFFILAEGHIISLKLAVVSKVKFMKLFSLTLLILFILLFAVTMFSQTPKPSPPVEDNNVVRISTSLIQVDATVLDKDGKIVTGLTADDFEIYENDKKQKITNFSFVELPTDKSTAPMATVKSSKNSIPIPPVPTKLRPEQVRRTIALIVDDLDLSFGSIDAVRSALKKYVDEQMQPNDLVAIIRTGSGGGFLQQFTSDKRILYKAIDKVRWNPAGSGKVNAFAPVDPSDNGAPSNGINPSLPPEIQKQIAEQQTQSKNQMTATQNQFNSYKEDVFTVGSLGAINYVVRGMSELPGRKAVVLFSEGFGLYDLDNGIKKPNPRLVNAFQRLTELANRSSVIIYAMDTRGIVNALMLGADDNFDNINQQGGVNGIEQVAIGRSTELYETQQGLKALAEQTGGFAIVNNNNLSKGMERVLNDQKGYYLIGYQPDDETFDPKKARFNKIAVKLKRPDLQIRYRSGFFGIKDEEAKPQAKTPQQQILAALTSPLSSGDTDLRLTSLFANDTQTGDFMRSLLYVNGDSLKFTEDTDGWQKATFDIVAMIFGENGNVINEVSRTETIKARAETLQEIHDKGFVSTITVPIKKPGAYQMHVVMRDAATSRIGSASQFIEVPDLKKDRLTLSGILLQRLQPQIADARNAAAQKRFQSDEQRDVATRSFRAGMDVQFGYAIYNAKLDKATKSPNLTMQFKIFQDGKETFASKEKSVKLVDQTDSQRLLAEGVFTLGKAIPSGDYVLQVIVRDLATGERNQIATQWIDFEVVK